MCHSFSVCFIGRSSGDELWIFWHLNFFNYCSLQPVKDTREKQIQLWKELILEYCRTHKIFVVGLDEDFPLFSNQVIESENYSCGFVS